MFKHNYHQIQEAEELSKRLGFTSFKLEDDGRNYGPILDNTGKQIGMLKPHTNDKTHTINIAQELLLINDKIELNNTYKDYEINCQTLRENSFYVNALGEIRPCCYMGSSFTDYKPSGNTLQEQLDNYKYIQENWNTTKCEEKCAMECGKCQ